MRASARQSLENVVRCSCGTTAAAGPVPKAVSGRHRTRHTPTPSRGIHPFAPTRARGGEGGAGGRGRGDGGEREDDGELGEDSCSKRHGLKMTAMEAVVDAISP